MKELDQLKIYLTNEKALKAAIQNIAIQLDKLLKEKD